MTVTAPNEDTYDRGKEDYAITPGDFVLVIVQTRKSRLDRQFDGPFTVLQPIGPSIQIRYCKRGKTLNKWRHVNRCKIYVPLPGPPTVGARSKSDNEEGGKYSDNSSDGEICIYDPISDSDIDTDRPTLELPTSTLPRKSGRVRRIPQKLLDSACPDYSIAFSSDSEK